MKRFLIFITILLTAYTSYAEKFNQDVTRLETPFYIFPRTGSQHIDMSPDWQLYSLDERIESVSELQGKEFIDVASPTSIQMAYYKAGKLPHPYEHMNSELYKYLGQQAHYYRKTFRTPATREGDNVYFCFDGIDYDAKVWVNGECIGAHSGMFGGPSIKIQPFLKGEGMENELIVEVLSANYKNPNISTRGAIDKIHSWFFSNDFASPTFYHLGMWNGSRLEILPKYHIERPYLVTEKISDGKATLQFSAELFSGTSSNDYSLGEGNIVHSTNPLNLIQDKPVKDDITVRLIFRDGENIAYEKVFKPYVIEGRCWMEESFDLDHPKLWYPNGMGDQSVYHVSAVLDVNGKKTDRIDFDFGIRTIEQVRSAGVRTEPRWK
ncbi:MAG: hypothetical protein KBS57_03550, partial [Alistipes sp.]|nr:hypothetical protein [Candidatus Minthomonas equi]